MAPSQIGIYPDIKQEKHRQLLAGNVSLFQMIYPRLVRDDKFVGGFFNAQATSDEDEVRQVMRRPRIRWQVGAEARIMFERETPRTAVAWAPDDPWWHNRLILMDQAWLLNTVAQLRRPNNDILSGAEVAFEIKCMEKVLKAPVEWYSVFADRKEVDCFSSEGEAKEFIDMAKQTVLTVTENKLRPVQKAIRKYEIKPYEKLDYKPEIKAIIHRERGRRQFGWTECDDFKNKLQPQIIEEIEKGRKSMRDRVQVPAADPKATLQAALNQMPQEEILSVLRDAAKKTVTQENKEVVT